MDENQLEELSSQGFTAARQRNSRIKDRLFRFSLGFSAFIIGLILLLPVDQWGRLLLRKISSTGIPVDAEQVLFSLGGSLDLINASLRMPGATEPLELGSLRSDVDLIQLLFSSKVALDMKLEDLKYQSDLFQLRGGIYDTDIQLADIDKNLEAMSGTVKLTAESIMVSALEEVPFLNDQLAVRLAVKDLDIQVVGGTLKLQRIDIQSNLFNIKGTGSVQLKAKKAIAIDLQILFSDLFFRKYEESGIKEILAGFQVLQPDQSVSFRLKGNVQKPIFEPVKVTLDPES